MGDQISREATIAEIKRIYCTWCNDYRGMRCRACEISDVMDVVEDMPAVDAEPVRRGEWIECLSYDEDGYTDIDYKCSVCGRYECSRQPYCHCGAKMEEAK